MGFMTPELPDVDPETWREPAPRPTRLQVVTRHWAEHGFGTPYAMYLLYLFKIAPVRRGARRHHLADPGPRRTEPTSRTGGRSRSCTRRSSSSRCCSRSWVSVADPGPLTGAVHAADRWIPVLVAAQDNSTAAMAEQGSVHPW